MKVGSDSVLLGALAGISSDLPEAARILDIGTGTGVMALMLAQRFPSALITGVEINTESADEASINFRESPYANRLTAVNADINMFLPENRYDLIVCNPPYFNETLHSPCASRATARHDDSLSPTQLMTKAASLLSPQGTLSVIYPASRDGDIAYAASIARLSPKKKVLVHTVDGKAPIRTVWEFSLLDRLCETIHLTMRDSAGKPTDEYIQLVNPFYITIK